MYVSVGSESNVAEQIPKKSVAEAQAFERALRAGGLGLRQALGPPLGPALVEPSHEPLGLTLGLTLGVQYPAGYFFFFFAAAFFAAMNSSLLVWFVCAEPGGGTPRIPEIHDRLLYRRIRYRCQ